MAPKVGSAVALRPPKRPERHVPGIHRVQGINSKIEDIILRGEPMVARVGNAITDVTLIRKIVGASELTLLISDPSPNRVLLRSALLEEAHEIELDGLRWKLVKVSSEGQNAPLALTYEPLIVYVLKMIKGPHKAFRDLMTRAEYAKARWLEGAYPKVAAKKFANEHPKGHAGQPTGITVHGARFISPELHVVQDVVSGAKGKVAQTEASETRGKGIGTNPGTLKVAGSPATKAQVNILDRMLRTGESKGAPTKVLEALVVTCIDESVVGTLSSNLLEQEPFVNPGTDHTNPEESALGFLMGYNGGVGAIQYAKEHPQAKVAEICTAIQKNRDGATPYERFLSEGKEWVAAYGGGAEVKTESTERYAFQQPKTETNWGVMTRLAGEVHWRCFESAGWVYFLDEPTLLRSPLRMLVSDIAPGIIDTTFDYDVGKEVQQVTVTAQAATWAAPPGSVAQVSRHGPANGLYLVEQIESKPSGRSGLVTATLKKPVEPLPEPAPKTKSGTASFGSGSTTSGGPSNAPAGVAQALAAMLAEIEATNNTFTYKWGGGHGSVAEIKKRLKGWDCSGYVSHILWVGGLLNEPLVSGALASKYESGAGKWLTIYANSGHVFGKIWTPSGDRFFECGGAGSTGWAKGTPSTSGFSARHPKGF